jgi:ribosomal protein L31E
VCSSDLLNQTVWERAAPKVQRTFEVIVQVLAQFLEGKGEPKE